MEEILELAKSLADSILTAVEIGDLRSNSPVGIAYRDFMLEWDGIKKDVICECGTNLELTIWSCPKCFPEGEV